MHSALICDFPASAPLWYQRGIMEQILSSADIERGLRRMAVEIIERNQGSKNLLLVGICRGGVPIAEHLKKLLEQADDGPGVEVGSVDITLYRDDASTSLPSSRIGPTELPASLHGRRVIICDDVLFTGRTIRAALDALVDYGRPAKVELAVILDRSGRELPIQADYKVRNVEVPLAQRIDLTHQPGSPPRWAAYAVSASAPSTPPSALAEDTQ